MEWGCHFVIYSPLFNVNIFALMYFLLVYMLCSNTCMGDFALIFNFIIANEKNNTSLR